MNTIFNSKDLLDLNTEFWNERYINKNTGWDLGIISTPLKKYVDQLTNKSLKILIPGGGHSYEAEYLYANGFKNVFVIDVSEKALSNFKKRVPHFPDNQLINNNFFNLEDTFDLILEQTFFCALPPKLRPDYVLKMSELLSDNGKLVGVLFNTKNTEKTPPFGGCKAIYEPLFKPHFTIKIMESCYNSMPPRANKELFIHLIKKII